MNTAWDLALAIYVRLFGRCAHARLLADAITTIGAARGTGQSPSRGCDAGCRGPSFVPERTFAWWERLSRRRRVRLRSALRHNVGQVIIRRQSVQPRRAPAFGRRTLAKLAASALGSATLSQLPGCAYYEAETGSAFEPWRFPQISAPPERFAVQAALLAASPHNTQPWAFSISPTCIDLRLVA